MSFWLYFSTSIIASTAVFVETARESGETSVVRESGIRGSVSCEEKRKQSFNRFLFSCQAVCRLFDSKSTYFMEVFWAFK